MELRINVDSDLDLRKFIKDQMRGQIDSLAREDLKEYLIAELERKLASKSDFLDNVLRETVEKWFRYWSTQAAMEKQINQLFEQHIVASLGKIMIEKDWSTVVERLAQKKFETMLIEAARK